MQLGFSLKDTPAILVAAIFLYGPYIWCRYKKLPYSMYGLEWFIDKKGIKDIVFALFATLLPLTVISMNWPGQSLPRYVPFKMVCYLAVAAICVAVIEETFYRGFMQSILTRRMNKYLAIALTSAVFAASHLIKFPYPLMLATFFPGLVMGILRDRNGNILTAIIYHFLGNVWSIWFFPSLL